VLLMSRARSLAKTDARALFTRLGTTDRVMVVIPGGDHAALLEIPRRAIGRSARSSSAGRSAVG
jgi:hypothetical protein